MPAVKSSKPTARTRRSVKHVKASQRDATLAVPVDDVPRDLSHCEMSYPTDAPARAAFRTRDGKKLTQHHWAVYDFTRTIPRGRVTTYGGLCKAIGRGSPRSVGSALRRNPFAPFVPCHRVVASNLYIGGFFGEWGTLSTKDDTSGHRCRRKIEMLATEGVGFTVDGYLSDESLVWRY